MMKNKMHRIGLSQSSGSNEKFLARMFSWELMKYLSVEQEKNFPAITGIYQKIKREADLKVSLSCSSNND